MPAQAAEPEKRKRQPRKASTYRGARRAAMIAEAKAKRRAERRAAKQVLIRTVVRKFPQTREAARRRRQAATLSAKISVAA